MDITCMWSYSLRKKCFGRKMGPLANEALCLSTPKHNGKSGTGTH
jgi:hypothetical protein